MKSVDETYNMPPHGWTCFFCGDTFTTPGSAQDHFGETLLSAAACRIKAGEERGLVMALRKAEKELSRYRADDSDKDRAMYAMEANHRIALIREEEKGYEKGVADMRDETNSLRQRLAEAEAKVPKWLPIESAPKDGTEIIGGWAYPFDKQSGMPLAWQKCEKREGWFSLGANPLESEDGKYGPYWWLRENRYPTHWQPTITPPQGDKKR